VTSFLPTIVTSPRGTVGDALAVLGREFDGAAPLGLHVEGPFLSPHRLGVHDPALRRDPELREVRAWLGGGMRMITLAPELPGALEATEAVVEGGGVAAIGHTDADAATTRRAIDAGARYGTHLFNAMRPLRHREPGPVGALLADDRVTVGLIADGVHVDALMLGLVARAAAGRVSLVSDAVATGLGGRALSHGTSGARTDDGTLAGGTAGLDLGVRTFAAIAGRDAAIEAVTARPAALLGLGDGRGTLRAGGRADIVMLTAELDVAITIVAGRIAFRSPGAAAPDPAPA
jgi:N-acetylglucosamine-6-phosphate deacetylase